MAGRKALGAPFWIIMILIFLGLGACLPVKDRGRWICGVCGLHERQTRICGVNVASERLESAFHDRFLSIGRPSHSHDWVRTGCHSMGGLLFPHAIGCSINREMFDLQRALALIEDDEKVKAAVLLLDNMAPDELRDEFRAAGRLHLALHRVAERLNTGDTGPLRYGESTKDSMYWDSEKQFTEYAKWWRSHEVWQKIFLEPEK